ncbi:22730_t:CDS:1, partial [Gigaspora rosea]
VTLQLDLQVLFTTISINILNEKVKNWLKHKEHLFDHYSFDLMFLEQ